MSSSCIRCKRVSACPLIPVNDSFLLPQQIQKGVDLIYQGSVIAIPTDTVYGLACAAQNQSAIEKLYKIKGRDLNKPLAICVGNVEAVSHWGKVSSLPSGLLNSLLPGPVTVVLERTERLNPKLNPNLNKVGIRVPDSKFVLGLCNKLKEPLALTSANASNEPSCLAPEEFQYLWHHLSAVFELGTIGDITSPRVGSTVVDLCVPGRYRILRSGSALESTKAILEHFEVEQDVPNCVDSVSMGY
ncbi:threonylcarbamoyl-AMP synthase [Periplaneta americana]|uniref:threonylcarbamoyl-AMP synthase n=1 Tax=Periplaneta americana TaxID=6978 RepID=UPI0037E73D17